MAYLRSVFGWGSWSGDAGVNVPHGTNVLLPLDSEDKPLSDVTFSNPDTKLTFNTAGTYLVRAAVFLNSGSPTTGAANSRLSLSAGTSFPEIAFIPAALVDQMTQFPSLICDVVAGATVSVLTFNGTDVDINFGVELAILRLA